MSTSIAIIGAGEMAASFADKAREIGIVSHCFAWANGAVAREHADHFHDVSITEKDEIVRICKAEAVNGVLATTELTVPVAAYIQQQLGVPVSLCYENAVLVTNKGWVREKNKNNRYLSNPAFLRIKNAEDIKWDIFPAIVKPASEGGKRGIIVVNDPDELKKAAVYSLSFDKRSSGAVIEQYIAGGKEYSVESLSYEGKHQIIQITEKESSGPPHCVELAHHQPAQLTEADREMIRQGVTELLDAVSFRNGITHTEIKSDGHNIYLIELNARPGGDFIANTLTRLSTGYDLIAEAIYAATGRRPDPFSGKSVKCSGIYFITKQTERLKPVFDSCGEEDWLYRKNVAGNELSELVNNDCSHQNYLIYCSDKKIVL